MSTPNPGQIPVHIIERSRIVDDYYGKGSGKKKEKKKTERKLTALTLTKNTKLTWSKDLNWDCVENGVANPVPCDGTRTMFICVDKEELKKSTPPNPKPKSRDEYVFFHEELEAGLALLKKADFIEKIDNKESEYELFARKSSAKSAKKNKVPIFQIRECSFPDSDYQMFELVMTKDVSAGEQVLILKALNSGKPLSSEAVMTVPHNNKEIDLSYHHDFTAQTHGLNQSFQFMTLHMTTGRSQDATGAVTTKFSLRVGKTDIQPPAKKQKANNSKKENDKTLEIAKGLFTYRNAEMGVWGATLEFIEVAQELQGFGIGTALYKKMEELVLDPFKNAFFCDYESYRDHESLEDYEPLEAGMPVHCCYVTEGDAAVFNKVSNKSGLGINSFIVICYINMNYFNKNHNINYSGPDLLDILSFLISKCGFEDQDGMMEELSKPLVYVPSSRKWLRCDELCDWNLSLVDSWNFYGNGSGIC